MKKKIFLKKSQSQFFLIKKHQTMKLGKKISKKKDVNSR